MFKVLVLPDVKPVCQTIVGSSKHRGTAAASWTRPIGSQYSGHVTCLDQSEQRTGRVRAAATAQAPQLVQSSPVIGRQRSRDLNTGLLLAGDPSHKDTERESDTTHRELVVILSSQSQ